MVGSEPCCDQLISARLESFLVCWLMIGTAPMQAGLVNLVQAKRRPGAPSRRPSISGDNSGNDAGGPQLPSPSGSGTTGGSLSRELSQSGGVIHPPASGDRGMVTSPPNRGAGRTPVIPPPGTPGGNPMVQPK